MVPSCVIFLWVYYLSKTERTDMLPWSKPLSNEVFGKLESTPARLGAAFLRRPSAPRHPIDDIVQNSDREFADLLNKNSKSLVDAAAAYRKRRGRHPPPGFSKWYEFAKQHDAIIIEDFWDQIYHDLEPFWALPPSQIRKEAWDFEMTISIRDGHATTGSDWFWTQIWLSLIKTIEHLLPDMDLALNAMDEPRMVVPWETMSEYMAVANNTRRMKAPETVVTEFQSLKPAGKDVDRKAKTRDKSWENTSEESKMQP
jgi:hypothetical protein